MPLTAHADSPKQPNFTVQYLDSASQQYVPKSLHLTAAGGTKLQESIAITNTGNTTGTANIYTADALAGQNGGIAYQPHTSPRRSVSTWITLPLNKVTLSPKQMQVFTVQITVPRGMRPGDYVGGIVAEDSSNQTFTRTGRNSKFSFMILKRSVLAVYITVPGTQIENLLTAGIKFQNNNSLPAIILSLNNLSTVVINAKGALLIADQKGRRIQLLPVQIINFLPQSNINYPVYLQGALPKAGVYRVVLELKYGHNRTLHMQSNVYIAEPHIIRNVATLASFLSPEQDGGGNLPFWQIAGLGALLLIGAGTICFWLFKLSASMKRRMKMGMRH